MTYPPTYPPLNHSSPHLRRRQMEKDSVWNALASKPLRVTFFVILFILSYYIGSPFSAVEKANPDHNKKHGWITWEPENEKAPPSTEAHNLSLSDVHENGPRVRQASMIYSTDRYNPIYERAVASHLRHGDQWRTPTHILRHDIVEAGFFNKPAYLLGLVIEEMAKPYGQRADWIVWFDADSILLNPGVPWNVFFPPIEFKHINFLASKDQNGFNAGMFMVRVHEWSVKMLSQVVSLREFRPELELPFDDQGATAWVLERPGYEEYTIYQPHNWWNSFGLQGKPFDHDRFVLHFAGVGSTGGEDKATAMGRWLDIIESEPDHYYRPLSELSLQAEITEFWDAAISAKNILAEADAWAKDSGYEGKEFQKARSDLRTKLIREADDTTALKAAIAKLEALKTGPDDDDTEAASSKDTTEDADDATEEETST